MREGSMAAATPAPPTSAPSVQRARDPAAAQLISGLALLLLAILVAVNGSTLADTVTAEWPSLVFWAVLIVAVNVLPVRVEDMTLTLDISLALAVAFIYPPVVAAAVEFVAAFDPREVRQVGPSRAVFNRAQIALSAFAASSVFHLITPGLESILVFGAAAGAVATDYVTNTGLVSLHLAARRGLAVRDAIRKLTVGRRGQFLLVYLGYGVLALVMARLFSEVGRWPVVTFIVPTLVARMLLMRNQELATLTDRLRRQERLLEKAFDRIVDERRDERLRVGAELHDEVLQSLTKIWMAGRTLEREALPPSAAQDARSLMVASEQATAALRAVIRDLQTSPLGSGGLLPSLRSLIRDLRLDWAAKIETDLQEGMDISPELQLVVYQAAREGLMNALKHAGAGRIGVSLRADDGFLVLSVHDDGRGFELDMVDSTAHFGLGLMTERVKGAGGELRIETERGRGTDLIAEFPIGIGDEPISDRAHAAGDGDPVPNVTRDEASERPVQ